MSVTGAEAVVRTLEALGVRELYGVAGTQNVELFEALRTSRVRVVAAAHELAAGFMANGAYRATGTPGVFATIPGPGLTYAMAALAEAREDSAAVVHLLGEPGERPDRAFQLQDLPQRAILEPLVKAFYAVKDASDLAPAVARAYARASEGEPGPVVVQIPRRLLTEETAASAPAKGATPRAGGFDAAIAHLTAARRVAFIAGQGAQGQGARLARIAARLGAPVFSTTSGRGALDERQERVIPFDRAAGGWDAVNRVLAEADAVAALGVKFTHNGCGGYRLRVDRGKLVHVDACAASLNRNLPAAFAVEGDCGAFLEALDGVKPPSGAGWSDAEWGERRSALLTHVKGGSLVDDDVEPRFPDCAPQTAAGVFAALRRALPDDGFVVTDSGLHQFLVRKHFAVHRERGLLTPADFQSMGFCLPAATAVKSRFPNAPVVAVLGDAGFAMTGLELLTNVRENLPLTVLVLNDGHDGLIRLKQLQQFGAPFATSLVNPDFEKLAASLGIAYVKLAGDPEPLFRTAIASNATTLLEARLADGPGLTSVKLKSFAKGAVKALGGGAILDAIRGRGA